MEYYPVEEVRPRPDGRLEVDLLVADERWLQRLLLRLAPHARVVSPAEFADGFHAAAQRRRSACTSRRGVADETRPANHHVRTT